MDDYKHLQDFLYSAGGTMFTTTCTSKERKKWLLANRDKVFTNGQMFKVKFRSLGAGVYEVSARELYPL